MTESRRTTDAEARRVGDEIGVDWNRFDLEQFRLGMDVEYEHGSHDPQTDVTGDDPIVTPLEIWPCLVAAVVAVGLARSSEPYFARSSPRFLPSRGSTAGAGRGWWCCRRCRW